MVSLNFTAAFGCGHPRSVENVQYVGVARKERCRACRLAEKRTWRERARANAEPKRIGRPPAQVVEPVYDFRSPEEIGSYNLLRAYARYYENHVKSEAA